MKHELPKLPYAYDALEPFIDARTMEIHHGKHHAGYVDKLNAALEGRPESQKSIEELIRELNMLPDDIRTPVRNFGGGHLNHSIFWTSMKPPADGGGGEPMGMIREAVERDFGGFSKFKETFDKAAVSLFGSGYAWLVADGAGKLSVMPTQNQDCPLTQGLIPLFVIDVWEHAYYLKYQNRRNEYVAAWWNLANWDEVARRFKP
ncbi:MAG: superoxide dismutase [Candidatus Niyogibacteria bacterium]|nr:superoxide dismutase [Candidatus Niyogibacteria bacterium]